MIRVVWPTVRPRVACEGFRKWLQLATDESDIKSYLVVNTEADARIAYDHEPEFELKPCSYRQAHEVVVVQDANGRPGVTYPATRMLSRLLSASDFQEKDIFILASDDFVCEKGWDEHVRNQYAFEWSGALICNDGYTKPVNIVPLPILSGACLKRLNGIIYSPHYSHFFSDQEFFDIVTELKIVKNLRGTDAPKFEHQHWTFGGRQRDKFDERNTSWWDKDKAMYERRKSLPVEEKLKLPDWWSE